MGSGSSRFSLSKRIIWEESSSLPRHVSSLVLARAKDQVAYKVKGGRETHSREGLALVSCLECTHCHKMLSETGEEHWGCYVRLRLIQEQLRETNNPKRWAAWRTSILDRATRVDRYIDRECAHFEKDEG